MLRRSTKINNPGKKVKGRGKEMTSREADNRRVKDADIEEEEQD